MPENDIEILGQRVSYPNSLTALSAVFLVIALAGWIAYLCISHPSEAKDVFGFIGGMVSKNTGKITTESAYRIGFWTPSENTYDGLIALYGGADKIPPEDQWEKVDAGTIAKFANELRDRRYALGWRYSEVTGQGGKTIKKGLWWTITASKSFDKKEFVNFYSSFWHDTDELYMEFFPKDPDADWPTTSTIVQVNSK